MIKNILLKRLNIILLFVLSLPYACSVTTKKEKEVVDTTNNTDPYYIIDSISPYGKRIKKYGEDSIYAFDAENDRLSYILYLDSLSKKRRVKFNNSGTINYVEYNLSSETSVGLINEYYYDTYENSIQSRSYRTDTIIITDGNPIHCFRLDIFYFKNSKISGIGYTGAFGGQNVPVGTQKVYSEDGMLRTTLDYVYPVQKDLNMPISEVFSYIVEKEYYNNGNPKWEKRFKNYELYEWENDDDYLIPIGTWKYYDESGKLVKTEKH